MYLSVIPAADVIAAVVNYFPPPRQVRRYDRCFLFIKYFPFGGLQRDFMRIAQTVAPEAIMFGFIPSRGKANALMF